MSQFEELLENVARSTGKCTCTPCTAPAYGAPGYSHCAACCYGTEISEYDYDCPQEVHRNMAVSQFGER